MISIWILVLTLPMVSSDFFSLRLSATLHAWSRADFITYAGRAGEALSPALGTGITDIFEAFQD